MPTNLYNQSYGFSSSHVWMWKLDHKEGWEMKDWCFWTVVLEKTLENPFDCKEIQPINPKGNQSWIFIERTDADAEAEAPILWSPDVKSWLIRKDPDAGKDWGQEENGTTKDETVGWHHLLNGHEFEQALADGDYSHEIKRRLLLGRKAMTNLDSIFKSRHITLLTKVRLVKAMVFPVVIYGCEIWIIKKLSTEELMLLNCGVGEDSWESLGLQGDPTSPS